MEETYASPMKQPPSTPPPVTEPEPPERSPDFDALYREHRGLVLGLCRSILRDGDQAHDASQEAWVKVRRGLAGYAGRGSARSWVASIAANVARDHLRERDTRRRVLRAALELRRYRELRAAEPPAETGPLLRAVAELEGLERDVIERRLADPEATLEDIAGALELPHHKIRYAWRKARRSLEAKLREWKVAELLPLLLLVLEGVHHG